ncbi:MAG: metallophosphoesterase [Pseudomonadales bacterium]|nr:metallophosphoesterase [Halioglobus sp.]MCP5130635.1 metallophosphoesterase [Pseudomonadales bacterium]
MSRLVAFLVSLLLAVDVFAGQYDINAPGRVVAFGDVHGAYRDLSTLLQEVGVVDTELNWIGGNTHLVSLGDLLDRGPDSRKVVELLMKLQRQAAQAGGAVHLVLGNHEVMVMSGDLRYVSPEEFAAFAADETQAERDELYAQYRGFNPEGDEADARQRFDDQYPPGFIALRKAFSRGGTIGDWLLEQPFVIKVNDKVYMHGGIASEPTQESLESLNAKMQAELEDFLVSMDELRAAGVMPWYVDYHDRLAFLTARVQEFTAANPRRKAQWFDAVQKVFDAQQAFVFSDDSLNWYRGTALCHPYAESYNTERFLKRVGARQLVIGHTPTRGDVHERMGGLAIRLDTGMLTSVYKGRASALISEGGSHYVHYLGGTTREQPVPEQRSMAQRLSGMSDAELEQFMLSAPVVDVKEIDTGVTHPWRVTQQKDGVSVDSLFKYGDTNPGLQSKSNYVSVRSDDSDRYVYDVSAYKLDRLLDLQMVPTAVITTIKGREGAQSAWVDNAINERDRLELGTDFEGYCKQYEQYRLRVIYDILIHNDDRNLTNILWTKDDMMLHFIDHSLAFRSTEQRPKQYRKVALLVSDLLRAQLASLNEQNLTRELSPYLHPRQIEAILARRDLILKEAKGTAP